MNSCSFFSSKPELKFDKVELEQVIQNHPFVYTKGLEAFQKSCSKLKGGFQDLCNKNDISYQYLVQNFDLYIIRQDSDYGALYTGYYEIELEGDYKKSSRYKYPIYKLPENDNLKQLSRAEINKGALSNENLEIIYVDDYAKLFFLHIQGSGRVKLPSGKYINIGYAGKNSHSYYSIGKWFVEEGIFTKADISALKIMDWLRANPTKAQEIMEMNQSYVYFVKREDRATGSFGVPLTSDGSIAIDSKIYKYGTLFYILVSVENEGSLQRVVTAQDTGGAIKGGLRADIFFGGGERAENLASNMKNIGSKFMLVPKNMKPTDFIKN